MVNLFDYLYEGYRSLNYRYGEVTSDISIMFYDLPNPHPVFNLRYYEPGNSRYSCGLYISKKNVEIEGCKGKTTTAVNIHNFRNRDFIHRLVKRIR